MVALSLKISIGNVVKTMQFEPSTMVYDACRMIRERVPEAQMGQRKSTVTPSSPCSALLLLGSSPALSCCPGLCFPSCISFFSFSRPKQPLTYPGQAWPRCCQDTKPLSHFCSFGQNQIYFRLLSVTCCCSA